MNTNIYCNKLDKFNAFYQEKQLVLAKSKGIMLHYNNAKPHTAIVTQ